MIGLPVSSNSLQKLTVTVEQSIGSGEFIRMHFKWFVDIGNEEASLLRGYRATPSVGSLTS